MTMRTQGRRGFTLVEAIAVMAIVGVLLAVLTVRGERSRRLGRLGDDMAHLRQMAARGDVVRRLVRGPRVDVQLADGQTYQGQYPDLSNAADDLQAQANQMAYLMRTRGGRPTFPRFPSFVAFQSYSHLVLADFLGAGYPWMTAISAGDRNRLKWARDPACFDQGCFLPLQPTPPAERWPYSGSFGITAAFVDESAVGSRLNQSGNPTNLYFTYGSQTRLGPQLLSAVARPAHKVLAHDQFAWHFGTRQPYCTHNEARLPLLFVDGSVRVCAAARTNPGWDPNTPSSLQPTSLSYTPRPWEPATMSGGRRRW
jgi:prepilin-type N-terminal cleavage/methylation domain-containing protein